MPNFKVVSVKKQERLRPDGGQTVVYRVWIETVHGSSAAIDVPAQIYVSDGLKGYLQSQADLLDKAFLIGLE